MRITFESSGSEIIFAGLDDVEKLKSISGITGIWIEEASELQESDFNQLDIRLRGVTKYYKQIILSFNPISVTHWLKKRFFDHESEKAHTHQSTYLDNRFLPVEDRETLEGFKDTDEYYYAVYCLGNWGITGKTVFNGKLIAQRLNTIKAPIRQGYFEYEYDGLTITDIKFIDTDEGIVKIYKDVAKGRPYVVGVDTAGDGSDSGVMQVIDNITTEQVCTVRTADMNEDIYARQLYCLGLYYNTALIAIESNFSTYPIREMERLRYPEQYVRESIDDFTHKIKLSYGFNTNTKTRPVIIAGLVKATRQDINIVNDRTTLEEMATFIRNEDSYKPEAEEGAHDDTVMALAIAHYCRDQQVMEVEIDKTVKWSDDMWDDYRNASTTDKELLRRRWGEPK